MGDGGFEAALKIIRPGVSEYEIASEIEHFARARGAEEHFTLVGSGRFILGDGQSVFFAPPPPSSKRVEAGDSVSMEISPRYEGYWTQIVRTVNVSHRNADLEKIHRVCCDSILKGLEEFGPGKPLRGVVLAMESYVNNHGYRLRPPLGHVCGVDLIEARVSLQNEASNPEWRSFSTQACLHPRARTISFGEKPTW